MIYRANTARFLDSQNNKSLVQFTDQYDNNGILQKISFSFIGIGSSSGIIRDFNYDFENLTVNGKPYIYKKENRPGTKEELKEHILAVFNKNPNIKLICPKEDCTDENCCPQLSIGNKITSSENTKQPYFASNCKGIHYVETPEHLNAKINMHKLLMEKAVSYSKKGSSTRIENIEIEKGFSSGEGVERRADVYYEKHYSKANGETVVEKFAIEVQRDNISHEELIERTQWYKDNKIAPFWVVVSNIFDSDKDNIESLSKKDFGSSLLTLISYSMEQYNDRFFIYDNSIKKVIGLTVMQDNLKNYNNVVDIEQKKLKTQFSVDNLHIISNVKEDNKNYKLLPYKASRGQSNIGSDLLSFGVFADTHNIVHKTWNNSAKKYEFAHFLKLGQINLKPEQVQYKKLKF